MGAADTGDVAVATGVADVAVVGGGVAGLVAARDLALGGRRVVLLEAGDHLGGCVTGHEIALADGSTLRLDAGADSFATRTPAVGALLADLGLGGDVVLPRPGGAWVRLVGRTVALPRAGMLGIPGRLWSSDVRAAIGVLGALRATADRLLPARVGLGVRRRGGAADGPVSLGRLVRIRLGRRVLDRLVAPVVTGVHSAHPDDVDLDAVLPGLRARLLRRGRRPGSLAAAVAEMRAAAPAGSAVAGVTGGMHRMVTALADDVAGRGVHLRTGARVTGLARGTPEEAGRGWVLSLADGATLTAASVVLAVPGPVAGGLLGGLVPAVRAVHSGRDTGVVLATLVLDAPALDAAPRGTGVLVADGATGVRAKALTHATAKWPWLATAAGPGRHVVRLSYGRAGAPASDASGAPASDALRAAALTDAAALLGIPLTEDVVVGFARTPWPGGLPHATPGHRERVDRVRTALADQPRLWACGAWLAGTGLASVVADAHATAAAVLAAGPAGQGTPPG